MTASESDDLKTPTPTAASTLARWAWLIAAVPLASAIASAWVVSGGDLPVFLVLATNMNVPTLLAASLLVGGPTAIALLTVFCVTDWRIREWFFKLLASNRVVFTFVLSAALLVAVTVTWWLPIAYLLTLALIVVIELLSKRFWPIVHRAWGWLVSRKGAVTPNSGITMITIGVVLIVVGGPMVPWLPMEQVESTNGQVTQGYVARSDSDWTTVLTLGHRIEMIRSDEITSRTVCNQGTHTSLANVLTRLLATAESFPVCDATVSTPAPVPTPTNSFTPTPSPTPTGTTNPSRSPIPQSSATP